MNLIDLKKECETAKNIVITGHVRPDGDCVGSCMAAYLYLNKVLDNANITVCLEQPADIFSCIKDFDKIDTKFSNIDNIDTLIRGHKQFCLLLELIYKSYQDLRVISRQENKYF